jgi:hypothetical protein
MFRAESESSPEPGRAAGTLLAGDTPPALGPLRSIEPRNDGFSAPLAALTGGIVYLQAAKRAAARAEIAARPTTGTAMLSSEPAGVDVVVDGTRRGATPLTLVLPAGDHQVELVHGDQRRAQSLTIASGATLSHFVEFAAPAPTTGRVEVASDPNGARVTIDGVARGVTPLTLAAISPGTHTIEVSRGDRTLRRTVTVSAGATSTVMMTAARSAGPEAGWVVFRAPFEMQVFEDGRLLGTTNADRLMLQAGTHELYLVAPAYKLRDPYTVTVEPGAIAPVSVSVPTSLLSVNAQPWADVWIDGRAVGATPLGNLSVSVGPHEVLWRHPQLGERRETIAVVAGEPTRVSTNFR